jgi:hypothetical protein
MVVYDFREKTSVKLGMHELASLGKTFKNSFSQNSASERRNTKGDRADGN